MIETLPLPADDAAVDSFVANAAVRAMTSARPVNRFWGAALSDRIEIAFGAERIASVGASVEPQSLHLDFHTPIAIDYGLAVQLRDLLTHWIDLQPDENRGPGTPDAGA